MAGEEMKWCIPLRIMTTAAPDSAPSGQALPSGTRPQGNAADTARVQPSGTGKSKVRARIVAACVILSLGASVICFNEEEYARRDCDYWELCAEKAESEQQRLENEAEQQRMEDLAEGTEKAIRLEDEKKADAIRLAAKQQRLVKLSELGIRKEPDHLNANELTALGYYEKASDQGDATAQFNLGACYANGQGVTKNEEEAAKWYRKAADQGDANGQCALGACYCNGTGVTKDEVEAYKWTLLAAAQGNEVAKKNNEIIEPKLSANQRAEGQRLAREWRVRR